MAQPITAPSGDQQEKLLKRVYRQYSIDPTSLQYIECHGKNSSSSVWYSDSTVSQNMTDISLHINIDGWLNRRETFQVKCCLAHLST